MKLRSAPEHELVKPYSWPAKTFFPPPPPTHHHPLFETDPPAPDLFSHSLAHLLCYRSPTIIIPSKLKTNVIKYWYFISGYRSCTCIHEGSTRKWPGHRHQTIGQTQSFQSAHKDGRGHWSDTGTNHESFCQEQTGFLVLYRLFTVVG